MTRATDQAPPRICRSIEELREAARQDAWNDPPLSQAVSDLCAAILERAAPGGRPDMSQTGSAISVATGVLQRGDRIVTADGIHAIVLRIDARDPKVGRWAECLTDEGQTLRFAATPDLTVTLLPGA